MVAKAAQHLQQRRVPSGVTLYLRRAADQFPNVNWPRSDDNLVVMSGEAVIGSLKKMSGDPRDSRWIWSITIAVGWPSHQMLPRVFLIVYYGSDGAGGWQPLDRPLRTLTTLDRFGLVTWQGREPMLQVEELRAAMGFPSSHLFKHGSRRDRIKMIGNAVTPPVMAAIVEALTSNFSRAPGARRKLATTHA